VVLGEAGAGKTRLLEELAAETRRDGGRMLVGRAYEMERVLPFGTWVEALRGGLATEAGVVAELDPVGRHALSLLLPELGPAADATRASGEVSVALFEAVTTVLTRLAARQPLVVALEDLHWADEMSVRLLAFVGRRLGASPVLLLATAREEELVGAPVLEQLLRDVEVDGKLSRITLRRLTRAATGDLVRALARRATRPTMARLAEQVWRASEGNPFMAVVTVRAFQEVGGPRSGERLPLPERVRELVTGRLERLSPRGREVAAAAAVLGSDVGFEVLQRTAGLDERATAEAIEELVRRRILDHAGGVFTFGHDQIRTVAYDRISAARRRVLHAAAGEALETVHGGRLEDVYGHLAHHYSRAGLADKMVTYLGHFAETARRRGALGEALRALDEALAQLRRAPRGEAERPHLELALRRAQIVSIQGRFQEVFDALLPLREVAERIGDPALTGHYHIRLAIGYANAARHADAVGAANRAIEEARRSGDDVVLGRAHYVLAITGFSTGDPRGGVTHARQAVALLERAGEPLWRGQAYWILGLNHFLLGEFDAALSAEERVFALAERHGDRMLEGFAAYSTALIQATRGDVAAAMAAAERGMARAPDRANRVSAQGLLGYAHLEAGDGARAIALLEAVIPQTTGFDIRRSLFTLHLADAYLRSGEPARARELAAGAVGVARGIGFRWGEAWGERLLGRIARESGDLPAAAAHLDAALAIFSGLAARFELALTGLDRAALAHARGDAAEAAERVQAARRELVALGVPVYVSRAEALAERLGVRLGAAPG
jgi:tetratricopeptide (TPR) repeat protein